MLDRLDQTQIVMVHMTTQSPYAVDDSVRYEENVNVDVFNNDIVQCSFLSDGSISHFMVCPDNASKHVYENNFLGIYPDEAELMIAVVNHIKSLCGEMFDGSTLKLRYFAGWKVSTNIWPMLVNKAFCYKQSLPKELVTDLRSRFSTNTRLLDVNNIYSQGVYESMRNLPAVGNVLRFWGYNNIHPISGGMLDEICEEPHNLAVNINHYLMVMRDAILRYYQLDDTVNAQVLGG